MQKLRTLAATVATVLLVFVLVFVSTLAAALIDTRGKHEQTADEDLSPALPSDVSEELPVAAVRRDGVQNFLICGTDRASGLYDVIILAQLDMKSRAASLVQIPRDTFAAYTDGSYRKLNGAASALGGIDAFADFLEETLGVPIDRHLLIDLDCVGDIVDAIGGVTLDVPVDMDYEDTAQGLSIHLKAGRQTLDGDTAEQYLRFRSGYVTADLGRLDAQKRFVAAFLEAVKEHSSLPDLIRIVRTLYGRVTTDVPIGEAIRLISAALKLSPDRLTMETLPGEATRTGVDTGAWYYVLCRDAAHGTVDRLLNVTDTPLPAHAFDPKERFTDASYPHFEAIYRRRS